MFTKIECGECGGDYAPKWDDLFQRWPDMTHHCPSCGRANVSVGLNSVLIETEESIMRDPWENDMRCDGVAGGAFGACSEDRVTVWHGMDTPARACGRHYTYDAVSVFRGHAVVAK